MRLTEHLFLVGSGDSGVYLTDRLDCNCYLLDCGDAWALIDAGLGPEPRKILDRIRLLGIAPEHISHLLLTHCHADHAGGASWLREQFGWRVVAPAAESRALEQADERLLGLRAARAAGYYPADYGLRACPVDVPLYPGDTLSIGSKTIAAHEAAGHSIGGLCYSVRLPEGHALFPGDLLAFGGKISLQLIPGADVHAYAESVRALSGLDIDLLLPGHGLFVLQGGQAHIDQACERFGQLFIPV